MKIGIITINDNNNYGNRLQNYATQEFIKRTTPDAEVETIKNSIRLDNKDNLIKYSLKYILAKIDEMKEKYSDNKRLKCFKEFNKNIKFNKKTINWYGNHKKIYKNYDFFITGSDQVWNPHGRMTDVDLLNFSSKDKNISFSASFGVNSIPENKKEKFKQAIVKFKKVSVRENAGKKIIEEVTSGNIQSEVLIDPTMLLDSKQWNKVAKKPENLKYKKYILNYFLGELSAERKQEIERIAKENDCEIINLLDKNSEFYQTGPSEFLYLEREAFLICTDSFHSCVFAILYNRPFIVFEREDKTVSMNSRIENLLQKFELKDRTFKERITNENLNCYYTKTYEILEKERFKSIQFLEESLEK